MNEPQLVQAYLADRDFICPDCSYNLRGLNSSVCPECGLAFRLTLVPVAGTFSDPADEQARLTEYLRDHDAQCPICRTSLRGHDKLRCPSCGTQLSVWLLRPRGVSGRDAASVLLWLFLSVLALVIISVVLILL
jgi:hypothetical protein